MFLGLTWTRAVDVFAAGCVMAELYLGRGLFHYTETDIERLALIERVLGPFPRALAESTEAVKKDTFLLEGAVRVRFPPPNVQCKDEVKRVMSAWALLVRYSC